VSRRFESCRGRPKSAGQAFAAAKASLDVTLASVVEEVSQFAVTINDVPNAILESVSTLRAFLDSEGAFQLNKVIDAHVFSQIVASTPPFGSTGTGLIAQIRNGVASMRATGANATLLVLNPTDAGVARPEYDEADNALVFAPARPDHPRPCGD
jgi:hypothetical protein